MLSGNFMLPDKSYGGGIDNGYYIYPDDVQMNLRKIVPAEVSVYTTLYELSENSHYDHP